MIVKMEMPGFLSALPKAIGKSAGDWHWRALLPVWPSICLALGAGAVWNLPAGFWSPDHQDVAVLVYVVLVLTNSVLLAAGWTALTKMYEAISAPGFFSYLISEELMPGYIVYIQFVRSVQIMALLVSALAVAVLLSDPSYLIYNRIAFAASVAASAYTLRTVSHLGHVLQDILWQKAIVDEFPGKQRATAKIVPLEREVEHKASV